MQIVDELNEIPSLSLALGFFDGLHLGHKAVIECAVEFARENSLKSAVITFKEHPRCYLNENFPKYILTKKDRYNIMRKMGVDYVIELDFPSVENMEADDYIKNIIVKYFSPKAISTGFNHHFGVNKSGGVKFLSDNQNKYNYIYFATPPQMLYGDVISSTVIRKFIQEGAFNLVNEMLGRKFSIKGTVVEGQKIGHTIGFPTANIIYPENIIEPAFGVYKTEVRLPDGNKYSAVTNYGIRPTVSNIREAVLEVHIPNFPGDLYGEEIKVKFLKRIRSEIKFDDISELKAQIILDIQELRK